jgi:hypothetical protein
MQIGRKEEIVAGVIFTIIPLMITAWSIKAGLLFALGYPLIALIPWPKALPMIAYLGVWTYIWFGFFVSYYHALVRDVDLVTKGINLVLPTVIGLLMVSWTRVGAPFYLIGRSPIYPFPKLKDVPRNQPDPEPKPEPPPIPRPEFDPYKVLGVSPLASKVEIESGYRKEIALYHPDKVAHLGDDLKKVAHERTLAIRRAFEALAQD